MGLAHGKEVKKEDHFAKLVSEYAEEIESMYIGFFTGNPVKKLKLFIDENPSFINVLDSKGNTILHYAAMWGDISMVEFLLTSGANLEIRDREGKTPIFFASRIPSHYSQKSEYSNYYRRYGTQVNSIIIFKMLVSSGADVGTVDYQGNTIIHYNIFSNQYCYSYHDDEYYSIFNDFLKIEKISIHALNKNNDTFLHLFSSDGNGCKYKFAKQLLERDPENINIFIKNKQGETPEQAILRKTTNSKISQLITNKKIEIFSAREGFSRNNIFSDIEKGSKNSTYLKEASILQLGESVRPSV